MGKTLMVCSATRYMNSTRNLKVQAAATVIGIILYLLMSLVDIGALTKPQGHEPPGLLPAGVQGVEAVVQQHHEALFHIVRYLVQLPEKIEGRAPAQQCQHEPATTPATGPG